MPLLWYPVWLLGQSTKGLIPAHPLCPLSPDLLPTLSWAGPGLGHSEWGTQGTWGLSWVKVCLNVLTWVRQNPRTPTPIGLCLTWTHGVITHDAGKSSWAPGFRCEGRKWESGTRKRWGAGHSYSEISSKNIWLSFFTLSKRLLKPSCLLLILFGLIPFPPTLLSGRASINGPVEVEGTLSDVSGCVWASDLSPSSWEHSALGPVQWECKILCPPP